MTQKISSITNLKPNLANPSNASFRIQSFLILALVLVAAYTMTSVDTEFTNILFQAVSDAYIQVSTFVAGTFFVFYSIERFFNIDVGEKMGKAKAWQVPFAAGLGALPGCGGAIIVITQYVSGRLSFGSVVATLTATMGDAAFLLIAQEPDTGLLMIVIGFSVGTLSGWILDHVHGNEFLRATFNSNSKIIYTVKGANTPILDRIWLFIMIPGIAIGVLAAFQIDVDALFANQYLDKPASIVGVIGGILAVAMRLTPKLLMANNDTIFQNGGILRRTVANTNFITGWVIAAFLAFELSTYLLNINLRDVFSGHIMLTPLFAVFLGFIPGCGPQILITTMYVAGVLPLSAQIGNAISNDGDALFPAIAIAPKVAIVATIYSAIPAIIMSYGWLFLFE